MLEVHNFSMWFNRYTHNVTRERLEVISRMNITVNAGEVHAVAGASGSGKSLLAHAILGILPPNAECSGEIRYNGMPLTQERLRRLRGNEIAFIPQSISYLDPSMNIARQIAGTSYNKNEVTAVLRRYALDESVMYKYPHELSGGMARRVLIAAAVIGGAKLVVADEPTPGLSEHLARETIRHLYEMAEGGCAVLLITHDIMLSLAAAARVSIFNAGTSIETAPREAFTGNGEALTHPYSKALWKALPQNGFEVSYET